MNDTAYASIDGFMEKHPKIWGLTQKKLISYFGTSTLSGIFCCTAASAAAGLLLGGENYIAVCAAVTAVMIWVQCFILSGFLKQWFFMLYCLFYFALPYAFTEVAQSDSMYPLKITLKNLSELCMKILWDISDSIGINNITASAGAMAAGTVLFGLGMYLRRIARRSDMYCRLRIKMY